MYHSADGTAWIAVDLPPHPLTAVDCCSSATILSLCTDVSGSVFITYGESQQIRSSTWVSPADDAFPADVSWSRVLDLPEDTQCDQIRHTNFISQSLREKTQDGAIFDVPSNFAIRIPGPTK